MSRPQRGFSLPPIPPFPLCLSPSTLWLSFPPLITTCNSTLVLGFFCGEPVVKHLPAHHPPNCSSRFPSPLPKSHQIDPFKSWTRSSHGSAQKPPAAFQLTRLKNKILTTAKKVPVWSSQPYSLPCSSDLVFIPHCSHLLPPCCSPAVPQTHQARSCLRVIAFASLCLHPPPRPWKLGSLPHFIHSVPFHTCHQIRPIFSDCSTQNSTHHHHHAFLSLYWLSCFLQQASLGYILHTD